jgi:N-acetyl-alpha-D-glucosaminyl L-malate synthase BshA
VIKVFNIIADHIPAKLLLIGDGPDRPRCEKESRETNHSDSIRFIGKMDVVEEILSVGDVFLLPSETESFGLAALEAMACQVPVICTNSGGLPELNVQGVTGYMSEIGNVDEMAANAISILENDATLLRFKQQALNHSKKFDIKNILPMYESLYERVIEENVVC